MPFNIIRNNITRVEADAIVNTANPEPIYGSGTDSAIYHAAGADLLLQERKKIGYINTGEAVATKAFSLPARYIIHTVGPAWLDGNHGEFDDLASCYRKSLLLASQLNCKSIAFPLISTGVYGFPKDKALTIALNEIQNFLQNSEDEMDIILVVFDKKAFDLSSVIHSKVDQYIDDHYVDIYTSKEYSPSYTYSENTRTDERRSILSQVFKPRKKNQLSGSSQNSSDHRDYETSEDISSPEYGTYNSIPSSAMPSSSPFSVKDNLEDVMKNVGESFQSRLLRLIDQKGYTDVEVYKKANIDRKLFSKIRCNENYTPKKNTALALAIALELNLDETVDLLGRAGIALSPSNKGDLIIEYCILHHMFNIVSINALLFDYDQPLLGNSIL